MKDSLEVLFDVGKDNPEFMFYHNALEKNPDADLDELEKEYHRLYDNKGVSIDTSNLNLEKIQDILQNTPTSTFVDFVKEKKKAKKTRKNIWELKDGEKLSTDNLLDIIKPNLIKEEYKMNEESTSKVINVKDITYFPKDRIVKMLEEAPVDTRIDGIISKRRKFPQIIRKVQEYSMPYTSIIGTIEKTLDTFWRVGTDKYTDSQLANIILGKDKYYEVQEGNRMGESFFNYEPYKKALKYFDVYRYKNDSKDDVEFFDFAANVKEALADISDFSYIDFNIDYDDEDGYIYIIPTLTEYPITVGYEDYAAEDILDTSFLTNYSDGTDEFMSDYNSVKNGIETEINKVNNEILPEFARTWNFKRIKKEKLNESVDNEDTIPLIYNNVWVEGTDYGPRDKETGEGTKYFHGTSIDYTYEADRQMVEEHLLDYMVDEDDPNIKYLDDDAAYKYISDHIDELVDKYYDKLLDSFRDVAEKDAEEHFYETTDLDDFDPQYDF